MEGNALSAVTTAITGMAQSVSDAGLGVIAAVLPVLAPVIAAIIVAYIGKRMVKNFSH